MKSREEKKNIFRIDSSIQIKKNLSSGSYKFTEIFLGFDELNAVKGIFGKDIEKEIDKLEVEVFPKEGFMGVSDEDGHIFASQQYINTGEVWSVYLDIIHELVHVRQFREGKNLFDSKYAYVDRPTEVEAYAVAVKEARRIGMNDEEIFNYLEVPWITDEEHRRLAKSTGVKIREESS
jgi:hypothetical protein